MAPPAVSSDSASCGERWGRLGRWPTGIPSGTTPGSWASPRRTAPALQWPRWWSTSRAGGSGPPGWRARQCGWGWMPWASTGWLRSAQHDQPLVDEPLEALQRVELVDGGHLDDGLHGALAVDAREEIALRRRERHLADQ